MYEPLVGHLLDYVTGPLIDMNKTHPTVIVAMRDRDALLAPICTWKLGHDETCILKEADLPEDLNRTSFVFYKRVFRTDLAVIADNVVRGEANLRRMLPDHVLARVIRGLHGSPHIKQGFASRFIDRPFRRVILGS